LGFELEEKVAEGGMAEVWRAVHRASRVRAAVKFVSKGNFDERHRRMFAGEVRAMAALTHPNVVRVTDWGSTEWDDGRYVPYLIMEWVAGGTLSHSQVTCWAQLDELLRDLLAALAHSHARGVIHRDIKPTNILAVKSSGSWKLTDFGIAQSMVIDSSDDWASVTAQAHHLSGTPQYMPPEQFDGAWRDYGPWTDLYSLGCVAWRVSTGAALFAKEGWRSLARAHIYEEPTGFDPLFPVPPQFESWLKRLLAKAPADRFQCAADAIWALDGMDPPTSGLHQAANTSEASDDFETEVLPDDQRPDWIPVPSTDPDLHPVAFPPQPATWTDQVGGSGPELAASGLSIYAMRAAAFTGRRAERDRIWSLLHEVRDKKRPRMLVFDGPSGVGKTRLIQWMATRAHETGAATVWRTDHGQFGGPLHGLSGLIQRKLQCYGLDRLAVANRIAEVLDAPVNDEDTFDTLANILVPVSARHDTLAPRARYAAVEEAIARSGMGRPAVVWLDDLQWGADTLDFLHWLFQRGSKNTPILVLATVQTEALSENPSASEKLKAVAALDGVERAALEPLTATEHAHLVQDLFGLDRALARELAAKTKGNPLFAVELVGDWIRKGLLEPTETGFELANDASTHLPDDLHTTWWQQLQSLLQTQTPSERDGWLTALETTSAFGGTVSDDEWNAICRAHGVSNPNALVERLVSRGLGFESNPGHWSLVHSLLGASLERNAREAGRWGAAHALCAKILESRYETTDPGNAERVGLHRLESDDAQGAADLLLEGAHQRRLRGEFQAAQYLLDRIENSEHDDSSVEEGVLFERAICLIELGQLGEAEAVVAALKDNAQRSGSHSGIGRAHYASALLLRHQGQGLKALEDYRQALPAFREAKDEELLCYCLQSLASASNWSGDPDDALWKYKESVAIARRLGMLEREAVGLQGLGETLEALDDNKGAREMAHEASQLFRKAGNKFAIGGCENLLATIAHGEGRWAQAEAHYLAALERVRDFPGKERRIFRVGLAITNIAADRWADAQRVLEEEDADNQSAGAAAMAIFKTFGLLACAANRGAWSTFDRLWKTSKELHSGTGISDSDLPWLVGRAAERACETSNKRAAALFEWAIDEYRRIGEHAAADRLATVSTTMS